MPRSRSSGHTAYGSHRRAARPLVAHSPAAGADGGARAEGLVAGFGSIWTTGENGLVRIDPDTGRVLASVRTNPADVIPSLAAGEGSVWSLSRRSVTRIDPDRDRALDAPVRLPALSAAVAAGAGALWVVDYNAGVLRKLDARTGHPLAEIRGVDLHAEAIVATSDALWVTNFRGRRPDFSVTRIDTASNRVVATLRLHRLLAGVTVGGGYVWVVNPGKLVDGGLDMSGGTLVRIDPRTERVATRPLPGSSRPAAITFSRGWLWIASPGSATVLRLNPRTLRETRIQIPF